jgi:hypothetical protein
MQWVLRLKKFKVYVKYFTFYSLDPNDCHPGFYECTLIRENECEVLYFIYKMYNKIVVYDYRKRNQETLYFNQTIIDSYSIVCTGEYDE